MNELRKADQCSRSTASRIRSPRGRAIVLPQAPLQTASFQASAMCRAGPA